MWQICNEDPGTINIESPVKLLKGGNFCRDAKTTPETRGKPFGAFSVRNREGWRGPVGDHKGWNTVRTAKMDRL
jgi:hypothetical protein